MLKSLPASWRLIITPDQMFVDLRCDRSRTYDTPSLLHMQVLYL